MHTGFRLALLMIGVWCVSVSLPTTGFAQTAPSPDQEKAPAAASGVAGAKPEKGPFENTRWRMVEVGGEAATLAGDLHFRAKRFHGASACNLLNGAYATQPEGGITFEVDRMTRRGCSGYALELEKAYLAALGEARSYVFDGDGRLVFLDAERKTLARLEKMKELSLEDVPLKIVSYLYDGGLYSVEPGVSVPIRFADGRLEGDTGCSLFSGRYAIDGDVILISFDMNVPKTDGCSEDLQRQDQAILKGLEKARKIDRGRNMFRLLDAEKEWAVLWLAPDDDPPTPAGESAQ